MSHLTKSNLFVPSDIKVIMCNKKIIVKGKYGELKIKIHNSVNVDYNNNYFVFSGKSGNCYSRSLIGTTRSILRNMLIGVSNYFYKTLQLVGVGYRVLLKDRIIVLHVGFSHSINYSLPEGIIAKCTNQNEIMLQGIDKQLVGQVAADLRSYRIPECYKGKGIRYLNEIVLIKEAKKK
ncbi:MAG: 50S ribosomal subunit protein L6 [Candidatus Westeberhardia cardiocondylae]|nr:50S ribosomal subunit protein L6 [Candidatus Westeberhardia cardiocondylae]